MPENATLDQRAAITVFEDMGFRVVQRETSYRKPLP